MFLLASRIGQLPVEEHLNQYNAKVIIGILRLPVLRIMALEGFLGHLIMPGVVAYIHMAQIVLENVLQKNTQELVAAMLWCGACVKILTIQVLLAVPVHFIRK